MLYFDTGFDLARIALQPEADANNTPLHTLGIRCGRDYLCGANGMGWC